MKIQNIILKHIEPITTGSVRRIGGTVMEVHLKDQIITLQLEKNQDNETVFYHPDWQFADKDLEKLIEKVLHWEEEYEQIMEEEYDEFKNDPEKEDDKVAIPSWI